MELFYADKQSQTWIPERLLDWLAVWYLELYLLSPRSLLFIFCSWGTLMLLLLAGFWLLVICNSANGPCKTRVFPETTCYYTGLYFDTLFSNFMASITHFFFLFFLDYICSSPSDLGNLAVILDSFYSCTYPVQLKWK